MAIHKTDPTLLRFVPNLRRGSDHTLSVYVSVAADLFDPHHYTLVLDHLVSRYEDRLGDDGREVLEREMPRVRAHVEAMRPGGVAALAVFADEGAGLLELVRLPAEVEPRIEVGPPLLAPLERLLERFPPALIAVVDKEQARTYGAFLGEFTPLGHLVGQDVRHTKPGGSSALSNQRKADNRTRANMDPVVRLIESEVRAGSYQRLYLAGPDEARAELERRLPADLKRLLAGHLSASLDSAELVSRLREQMQGKPGG